MSTRDGSMAAYVREAVLAVTSPWLMLATKNVACPSHSRDAVAAASQWHLTALIETGPLHVSSDVCERKTQDGASYGESREAGVLTWLLPSGSLFHTLMTTVNTRMSSATLDRSAAPGIFYLCTAYYKVIEEAVRANKRPATCGHCRGSLVRTAK